jgi:fatty-acyl-CoA synthase
VLEGLMQNDFPLTVAHIRRRASECYGDRGVATLQDDGVHRTTYREIGQRVDRLGHVLERLGVERGTRVGTFAWNTFRHLELYLAVPSFGAVLHTLNIRLSADQVTYIADHAEDRVVFVDDVLASVLAPIARRFESVRHWVIMGDGDASELEAEVPVVRYEELVADAPAEPFDWPDVPERAAAALCYTSGTTGRPKGVLYSHRSIALHAASNLFVDGVGLSRAHKLLAVVPMFHVNAWGLPFAAPLTGAELVLPGGHVRADALANLIETERCTMMNAVPTVFADLLRHADAHHPDLSSLTNGICGGAAVGESLARGFEERHGVRIYQAWGMTETSPICTVARPPKEVAPDDAWRYRLAQGHVMPWVELRIVADDGAIQPRDGRTPARAVGRVRLLRRRIGRRLPRRMAADGRHRPRRREGLPAHHRSREGPHQVGGRVDLVHGARERAHGPSRHRRGSGRRQARRALERASPGLRGRQARRRPKPGGAARLPRRARAQVVAARRVRLHRGGAEDLHGQVRQEGAARPVRAGAEWLTSERSSVAARTPRW